MTPDARLPTVSVVVASHGRAGWLRRCLTGLAQLDYPAFEIVVAADAAGRAVAAAHPVAPKIVASDLPNISLTRNAGIAAAAGEIVAFIDDDAVPESMWLRHMAQALVVTGADAAAGFVRGRNGISFQSRIAAVDAEAETHALPVTGTAPEIPFLAPGRALKLVGTNMAVRREVLLALRGFDPAFRYYLDDTDLSLRLAAAGHRAVAVPLAEVHHGSAPSARRGPERRPTSLNDIGRSTAIFLRRHPGGADRTEMHARMHGRERARLLRHMVRGSCEPGDIAQLLAGLDTGWQEGLAADLPPLSPVPADPPPFRPVAVLPSGHAVLMSRLLRRRTKMAEALRRAAAGERVSLFSFSLTPVRHHLRYVEPGVWVQTGGQFGRSLRDAPRLRWCRFADRVKDELRRVALQRGIDEH